MKKVIAIILSLCLLCGATAFATEITENWGEGTTKVTYTVEAAEPCYDFIVTIPAAITISAETTKAEMTVKLDASSYTATDKNIYVGVGTSNDFTMVHTADSTKTIAYNLVMDNGTSNGDQLGVGRAFLVYDPATTTDKVQTANLTADADDTQLANADAGTYEDELTFSVYLS